MAGVCIVARLSELALRIVFILTLAGFKLPSDGLGLIDLAGWKTPHVQNYHE